MTKLRAIRKALGLTTYDVADLIGCSQSSVSKAEREVGNPGIAIEMGLFFSKVFEALGPEETHQVHEIAEGYMRADLFSESWKRTVNDVCDAMAAISNLIA